MGYRSRTAGKGTVFARKKAVSLHDEKQWEITHIHTHTHGEAVSSITLEAINSSSGGGDDRAVVVYCAPEVRL